jgi:rhomboid protease GluP
MIAARSEKQAMDWSLVLLSQGIESVVQPCAEGAGWNVVVDAANYRRSLEVLRLYITENRRGVWVQKLPWSQLIFDWRSAAWFALLAILFVLVQNGFGSVDEKGIMSNKAVRTGEWWRLFTATMLHSDLPHLLSNLAIGTVFLGLAMAIYGPGIALLASFLSGAAGNLAGLALYPHPYFGRGASGMVMGALGLLATHMFWLVREQHADRKLLVRSLLGGLFLLVLLGFDPASDVIAHLGGFVSGLAFGALVSLRVKSPAERPLLNTLCGLACGAIAAGTWYLALRH